MFQKILASISVSLLTKLGAWAISGIKDMLQRYLTKKEQKKKTKAIENAKDPEDIRSAHRNNKL